jgi:hypothetical protein
MRELCRSASIAVFDREFQLACFTDQFSEFFASSKLAGSVHGCYFLQNWSFYPFGVAKFVFLLSLRLSRSSEAAANSFDHIDPNWPEYCYLSTVYSRHYSDSEGFLQSPVFSQSHTFTSIKLLSISPFFSQSNPFSSSPSNSRALATNLSLPATNSDTVGSSELFVPTPSLPIFPRSTPPEPGPPNAATGVTIGPVVWGGIAGGAVVLLIAALVIWKVVGSRREEDSEFRNEPELDLVPEQSIEGDSLGTTMYISESNALYRETNLNFGLADRSDGSD